MWLYNPVVIMDGKGVYFLKIQWIFNFLDVEFIANFKKCFNNPLLLFLGARGYSRSEYNTAYQFYRAQFQFICKWIEKNPLDGKIQHQIQFEIQYSINSNHRRRQRCIDIVVELQNINFRGSYLSLLIELCVEIYIEGSESIFRALE